MSFRIRSLNLTGRALEKSPAGSVLAPARTTLESRRYGHASDKYNERKPRSFFKASKDAPESSRSSSPSPTTHLTSHLNDLFRPLEFTDELARRILTHGSHRDSLHGHNARLAFIGRRVLEAYLLIFLHSVPPDHHGRALDFDLVTSRTLNTYVLGENVATRWSIGRMMRWAPVMPSRAPGEREMDEWERRERQMEETRQKLAQGQAGHLARSLGLYKVSGLAVEAVAGGIFHQFGGLIAHRIFHTRILPHILLPNSADGLHDSFHSYALEICDNMGGVDSPIVAASEREPAPRSEEAPMPRKVEFTSSSGTSTVEKYRRKERADRLLL